MAQSYGKIPKLSNRAKMLGILLLACLLRLPWLFAPLWYDEIFTATVARLDIQRAWTLIQSDTHPVLAYAISWVTVHLFGQSDWVMRVPMLLISLFTILLVYGLVLDWTGERRVAWVGALLLALLPAHIFYATQARHYIVLTAVVWLCAWLLPRRPRLGFCLLGILPYIHAFGYFYVLLMGVWGFLTLRQQWKVWGWAAILGFSLVVFAIPLTLGQAQNVVGDFWIPPFTIGTWLRAILDLSAVNLLDTNATLITLVWALLLLFWGLWSVRKWLWSPMQRIFWVLFVGVPMMVTVVSIVWQNVFLLRYLLPSLLLVVVLLAVLVVDHRVLRLVIPSALIVSLLMMFGYPLPFRVDYRSALAPLAQCDRVGVVSPQMAVIVAYYFKVPIYLWQDGHDPNQYLSDDARDALDIESVSLATLKHVASCIVETENPLITTEQRLAMQSLVQDRLVTTVFAYDDFFIRVYR